MSYFLNHSDKYGKNWICYKTGVLESKMKPSQLVVPVLETRLETRRGEI